MIDDEDNGMVDEVDDDLDFAPQFNTGATGAGAGSAGASDARDGDGDIELPALPEVAFFSYNGSQPGLMPVGTFGFAPGDLSNTWANSDPFAAAASAPGPGPAAAGDLSIPALDTSGFSFGTGAGTNIMPMSFTSLPALSVATPALGGLPLNASNSGNAITPPAQPTKGSYSQLLKCGRAPKRQKLDNESGSGSGSGATKAAGKKRKAPASSKRDLSPAAAKADKMKRHNQSELKRRETLNTGFEKLALIATTDRGRKSKAAILMSAVDKIEGLEAELTIARQELQQWRQSGVTLRDSDTITAAEMNNNLLLAQAAVPMALLDLSGKITACSIAFAQLFQFTNAAALVAAGLTSLQITHPDALATSFGMFRDLLENKAPLARQDMRFVLPDTRILLARQTLWLMRKSDGTAMCFVSILDPIPTAPAAASG